MGVGTRLGRIAALTRRIKAEISPLQKQVNRAACLITTVAIGVGALFLAVGKLLAVGGRLSSDSPPSRLWFEGRYLRGQAWDAR
jgi:magnesium-transporting ATPase (P-type)